MQNDAPTNPTKQIPAFTTRLATLGIAVCWCILACVPCWIIYERGFRLLERHGISGGAWLAFVIFAIAPLAGAVQIIFYAVCSHFSGTLAHVRSFTRSRLFAVAAVMFGFLGPIFGWVGWWVGGLTIELMGYFVRITSDFITRS